MQDGSSSSWITYDRGRRIHLDSDWNPRLFVHELIHVWDGSLGFTWSAPNREYSDDLSGFAEIARDLHIRYYISLYRHILVIKFPKQQVRVVHGTIGLLMRGHMIYTNIIDLLVLVISGHMIVEQ